MVWSKEKIMALSQADRHRLYNNAKARNATGLVRSIEECGFPYSDPAGVKLDSPLGRAMREIINSPEGVAVALQATKDGLPALGGIDLLLQEKLGQEYRTAYEATIQAGYLTALMMRQEGYEETGRQARLVNCVAKSGEIYEYVR